LKPVADLANAFWPGARDDTFVIGTRLTRGQRRARESDSVTNLYVGATYGPGGQPEAHLLEFGTGPRYQKNGRYTGQVAATPMLQPAWDMNKNAILRGLAASLWDEIAKTQARRAKRAAK